NSSESSSSCRRHSRLSLRPPCRNTRGGPSPVRRYATLRPSTSTCDTTPNLEDCGLTEQRLRLGKEIRHRLDLVLRPEDELLRALGHLEQKVHARVTGKILHEQREIADDTGT